MGCQQRSVSVKQVHGDCISTNEGRVSALLPSPGTPYSTERRAKCGTLGSEEYSTAWSRMLEKMILLRQVQEMSCILWAPKVHPAAICTCPASDEPSPCPTTGIFKIRFNTILPCTPVSSQSVSFREFSPQSVGMHIFPPYVPNDLTISFVFLITRIIFDEEFRS